MTHGCPAGELPEEGKSDFFTKAPTTSDRYIYFILIYAIARHMNGGDFQPARYFTAEVQLPDLAFPLPSDCA